MAKSPDAFRTISEVADWLGVEAHVLRFWESRFTQVKPVKRAGGRRYYRPSDMALLGGIRRLLHEDGMTIRGVQKILREQGVSHVASLSPEIRVDGVELAVPARHGGAEAQQPRGGRAAQPAPGRPAEAPRLPLEAGRAEGPTGPEAAAPPDAPAVGTPGRSVDAARAGLARQKASRLDREAQAQLLERARALAGRLRRVPE